MHIAPRRAALASKARVGRIDDNDFFAQMADVFGKIAVMSMTFAGTWRVPTLLSLRHAVRGPEWWHRDGNGGQEHRQ